MAPRSPLRILVVAHTHWDREWYHSAGAFRRRLVALVDDLLDDPPPAGQSFLLDGQAIVLDDYLEVRPERAAELAALLRDGRLEAGPWYVLADELIPGGEALVRNLLAGRDALRALRAVAPPVLYCPDAFGHPATLPDLASGFGLPLVIVWRGLGGARWPIGDAARWRGAAGSNVLVHHLTPDGYELGSSLPVDLEGATRRWRRLQDALRPRAALGAALLLNGADHHARQRDQQRALTALAAAAHPDETIPTTLAAAAAVLLDAARSGSVPSIHGELRDSYGYTWTLQGTLGARASQKRENARLERLLVRDVEPWLALSARHDDLGDRALLRAAWRSLLAGQPHDTLCGTSIDAVAIALDARHADVRDRAESLRTSALSALLHHDVERARRSQQAWRPALVVRNRTARARSGVAELTLRAMIADVAVGPGSATRQGPRRAIPPWRVGGVPLQLLARRERVELTESPRDYPDADLVAEVRAVGWIDCIDGLAVTSMEQGPAAGSPAASPPGPVRVEGTTLDNGRVRVEVGADGGVVMIDLARGRRVEHLLALEDERDAGDLYTPAIREPLPSAAAPRVRVVHRGPLRGEIAIEHRLPSSRGRGHDGRCTVSLALDAGARFLRARVRGHNRAGDHRLRLCIASGMGDATTVADAAFHPVERHPLEIGDEDAAMEQLVPTAPLHRWVSRYGADAGATIFSDGLAEYESLADGGVAITLLRAVGALSRADLPERPGHAGWPAETPLAQSIGPYEAELAIALHGPDSPEQRDDVERMADDVLLPLVGETLRSALDVPRQGGGLELLGDGLAFSAAMPAREPGVIVLRCVNRRDAAVRGAWRTARRILEARLARLDETPLEALAVDDRSVAFVAPPRAIVTVLLRWAEDD
jgi:alpha-mannosidase